MNIINIQGEEVEIPEGYHLVKSDSHRVRQTDQWYSLKTKTWQNPDMWQVGRNAGIIADFIITKD